MKDPKEDKDRCLKELCNRYTNGECHSLSCLQRGGYTSDGPFDHGRATCPAHELLLELQRLRKAAGE